MSWFRRKPRHVHQWTAHKSAVTEVYGDGWGNKTEQPVRRFTDISGVCATCHAPLHRQVEGVWEPARIRPAQPTAPTEGTTERDAT